MGVGVGVGAANTRGGRGANPSLLTDVDEGAGAGVGRTEGGAESTGSRGREAREWVLRGGSTVTPNAEGEEECVDAVVHDSDAVLRLWVLCVGFVRCAAEVEVEAKAKAEAEVREEPALAAAAYGMAVQTEEVTVEAEEEAEAEPEEGAEAEEEAAEVRVAGVSVAVPQELKVEAAVEAAV